MVEAIEHEHPDEVIHLGDHTADAEELGHQYSLLPILIVRGNCDWDFTHQEQILTEYDHVRVLAAHGHRYGVKSGLLRYELAAKECQADLALFGHTHQPYCEQFGGLWMLNPGSCGYAAKPSYGIVEIENGNILNCRVCYFNS